MILPDANLLIYAYDASSRMHGPAKEWWAACLSGQEPIGMPWMVLLAFLRVTTNRRIFKEPLTVEEAMRHIDSWLERPPVQIIHPGPKHRDILFGHLNALGIAADLTSDAHLAALAMEYRAILYSADSDFQRFSGLRWINPLAPRRPRAR